MKKIVVSAVNLNVGGTLTILRDCLSYLSEISKNNEYEIIAIVYDKELAYYPNITYIENQWPKKRWVNRLWFEYVSLNRISKEIGPVHLWLSLHDTTPNVVAERKAVYCHNPFPFHKWKWKELAFAPKIVLFSLFSKYIYKKGISDNDYVIVQQAWIRNEFVRMFKLSEKRIIIALPNLPKLEEVNHFEDLTSNKTKFIYPASPNTHKNFECLCAATAILEEMTAEEFQVNITLNGEENSYSKWLFRKWGHVKSLHWIGFVDRKELFHQYAQSDCLVFPSKVETWGLPITEFSIFNKMMLLSDLPYAKETAAGSQYVRYFDPNSAHELATLMLDVVKKRTDEFTEVKKINMEQPFVNNWNDLFLKLLA